MPAAISDGKHIDAFIPPHLKDMFYRHPTRPYAWNNGLDPYGFSTNGLLLYLPLWALNNGGTNSIQSVDAYRHTCTITGALWQPNGRPFDGTDDRIALPTGVGLTPATGTLMCWVNFADNTTDGRIFSSSVNELSVRWVADEIILYYDSVAECRWFLVASVGSWAHLALTFTQGGSCFGYEAGVQKNTTAISATAPTEAVPTIGAISGGGSSRMKATIGEFWIYSRALTVAETLRNRNATAWRYQ